jgi:hypothetical protein
MSIATTSVALIFVLVAGAGGSTGTTQAPPSRIGRRAAPATMEHAQRGIPSMQVPGRFEGDIRLSVTNEHTDGPELFTVTVHGDKVRYDLPSSISRRRQPVRVIVDERKKEATVVVDRERAYAVVRFDQLPPRPGAKAGVLGLEDTGQRRTIAGHPCKQWRGTPPGGDNARSSACFATDLPRMDYAAILPSSLAPRGLTDEMRAGELPLRAQTRDESGRQTSRFEVISIQSHAVPDATFAVPRGYSRVALPTAAFVDLVPLVPTVR